MIQIKNYNHIKIELLTVSWFLYLFFTKVQLMQSLRDNQELLNEVSDMYITGDRRK